MLGSDAGALIVARARKGLQICLPELSRDRESAMVLMYVSPVSIVLAVDANQ